MISRHFLPSSYRPQDGDAVRADIAVADLHSGRMFGVTGALVLDAITLTWLTMLATGLVMYFIRRRSDGAKQASETEEDSNNGS